MLWVNCWSMTKPTRWPVHPSKIQISLGICPVWSESFIECSMGSDQRFLPADSKDGSDWVDVQAICTLLFTYDINRFYHDMAKIKALFEQCHEIIVLFVLHKPILQTSIRSHPVGLDVLFLVAPFVHFHTLCVRTAKALVRLCVCAGLPELSLVAYVISTIISWAGSFDKHQQPLLKTITSEHSSLELSLVCPTSLHTSSSNSGVIQWYFLLSESSTTTICFYLLTIHEPRHENTCLPEFPTRSDSNWPAQLQKLARGLKFWI